MKYIAINATSIFKDQKTGVEWYSLQLVKYLIKEWKGNDPKVVLLAPEKLVRGKENLLDLPKNWQLTAISGNFLWTQFWLLRCLKKNPPLLLFSPSYVAPFFLGKIKTVNVIHGLESYYDKNPSYLKNIQDFLLTEPAIKRSSKIVAVSHHTKEDLVKFLKIAEEIIHVIQSGPGAFSDEEVHFLAKIKEKDQNNLFISAFFGGNNPRKNLEKTIKIFLRLIKIMGSKVKFYVSGEIQNRKIENIFKKNNKNFVYKKYFSEEEKKEYLEKSHFLFYLSSYEGFGFPVLEAQKSGAIPVILKQSGLAEVSGQGVLDFGKEESESKTAREIVNVFKNQKFRRELVEAGYENLKRFSWQRCAEEVRSLLIEE